MDDRFNTIAGWVLGGGIVLLGGSLITGEYFKAERPETMGYPIAGVVEESEGGGEEAELPIAALLQTADAGAGEAVFRKCTSCHGIGQAGGGPATGPNLWGVVGTPIASRSYNYSPALREKGGTWTWEAMNEWLRSPRAFAPGTKMTFAGLGDPEDRANLIAYLNAQGSNLPLPPPPSAETPAEVAAEQADMPAQGDMAAEQPELDPATTPRTPGTVGGPGAPDVTGREGQEKGE